MSLFFRSLKPGVSRRTRNQKLSFLSRCLCMPRPKCPTHSACCCVHGAKSADGSGVGRSGQVPAPSSVPRGHMHKLTQVHQHGDAALYLPAWVPYSIPQRWSCSLFIQTFLLWSLWLRNSDSSVAAHNSRSYIQIFIFLAAFCGLGPGEPGGCGRRCYHEKNQSASGHIAFPRFPFLGTFRAILQAPSLLGYPGNSRSGAAARFFADVVGDLASWWTLHFGAMRAAFLLTWARSCGSGPGRGPAEQKACVSFTFFISRNFFVPLPSVF